MIGYSFGGGGRISGFDPASGTSIAASHRWRADTGIALVGSKVSVMNDMIGAMHQRQSTDASRFTLTPSDAGYNNQPVLLGTTSFMLGDTDKAIDVPMSLLIVGEMTNTGAFLSVNTSTPPYNLVWWNTVVVQYFTDQGSLNSISAGNSKCAILITDDASNGARIYMNRGGGFALEGSAGRLWGATTAIGIGNPTAGVTEYLGKFAEALVWPGVLNASDRNNLAGYVGLRYGIRP